MPPAGRVAGGSGRSVAHHDKKRDYQALTNATNAPSSAFADFSLPVRDPKSALTSAGGNARVRPRWPLSHPLSPRSLSLSLPRPPTAHCGFQAPGDLSRSNGPSHPRALLAHVKLAPLRTAEPRSASSTVHWPQRPPAVCSPAVCPPAVSSPAVCSPVLMQRVDLSKLETTALKKYRRHFKLVSPRSTQRAHRTHWAP